MIQNTLLFSTKFNAVPVTDKFVFTDLSPYSAEGIALTNVTGVFKIEGPGGIIYNNTNFAAPDIIANTSLVFGTVSIPIGTDGNILAGNYTITYTARIGGGVQPGDYVKKSTVYYCYVAPTGNVDVTNSVRLAKVTSKDLTSYPIVGVMPTITRVQTLYYPSSLVLAPTVSNLVQIQLSYPNVYTGTYTGNLSSVASYVFTDGLIVDYLITAVDETIVDNKTLCDIYCGVKNLANEMLTAKSTGDFGKANKIQETLSLVSILFTLYDDAITCGKESDATSWLNQIITLANIVVGCGCTGDAPTLVVPEGGGGSSGNVSVVGDASFGTAVTAVTVGPATTYTVRLTQAYKDLILAALQTQSLSVASFRAAGIPEEARGLTVTPVTPGGGTISLTPGVSTKLLVLTGTTTLTSALTVQTVGSPIDGDSFVVDYRATLIPNGNNITIFGLGLSPSEAAGGNSLVYTWYSASNSTWYSKLIRNQSGSTVQGGLTFWVSGSDFALSKPVLYGTNPSNIYKNIVSAGSGTNPPSGTTASNTYWQYVGNKSALFDSSDNVVFDVTTGKPFIIPTLNTSTSAFTFLVLEGQEIKNRALSTLALAGTGLTNNKILVGNSSAIATEQDLSTDYFRSKGIAGVTGSSFLNIVIPSSGIITVLPSITTPSVKINGTTTLVGNVLISPGSANNIIGDYFWFDYSANVTTGGNSLVIAGITLTPAEALAGSLAVYSYWDYVNAVWISRKITYGITIPSGTVDQTVRYNSSNVLVSDPNITQDVLGNLTALKSLRAGITNSGTGSANVVAGAGNIVNGSNNTVGGSSNQVSGTSNFVSGINHVVSGINSAVSGNNNNIQGSRSVVSGDSNTVLDSDALVVGSFNTATGVKAILGNNNIGTGGGSTYIVGSNNNINGRDGFLKGFYGILYNAFSSVFSASYSLRVGLLQRTEAIYYMTTGNESPTFISNGLQSSFKFGINECHIIEVKIIAYQTGGSAGATGDSSVFKIKTAAKSIAGAYSLIGAQVIDGAFSDTAASGWTASVFATSDGFTILVTGQLNKHINWTAHITTVNAG